MIGRLSVAVAAAGFALSLGGCQTSGLASPQADEVKRLVGKNCVLVSGRDEYSMNRREELNDVTVYTIDQGEGGWERYDVAANGTRFNAYVNRASGRMYCSSDAFKAANGEFKKRT